MFQVVSPQVQVQFWISPCGICGVQSGTVTSFVLNTYNPALSFSFHQWSILIHHLSPTQAKLGNQQHH
jgi:hypothetical protein